MMKCNVLIVFLLICLMAVGVQAGDNKSQQVISESQLWTTAGDAFVRDADKSAAMQHYQLYLSHYKKSDKAAKAQFMLAECYFQNGDYATAINEFEKVQKYNGRYDYLEASMLLRVGECQYNLQMHEEALLSYTRLLEKYPDSFLTGEAFYELGQTQASMQNWHHLETTYKKLLEDKPGYRGMSRVEFALGIMDYAAERYDEASVHFETVESDLGLYYLGRCLEETGQYILAIQRYRQALRHYPDSPLADDVSFSIAEAFYDSGQFKVASRSYNTFLDQFPESKFVPMARYKLACVSYRTEDFNDCIRRLEELCEAYPDDPIVPQAHYLKGSSWMKTGQTSHAIFSYTEVVRRFQGSQLAASALHKIVYAYADEKNYSQAVLMAQEFMDLYGGNILTPRVQLLHAYSLLELGENELAIREFQNVMDRDVNTEIGERALFLSTATYYNLEQFDRLITNFHFIANRLLPTPSVWRARTYHHLGEAYYAQGLFREASGMFRLVLTGYPRSDVAVAALQGLVASHSQLGEYDIALQEQEKFLFQLANADSEEGQNSLAVGSLYFNQHNYEEALTQFTIFLEKNREGAEVVTALLNQGDCYYRLQYYEQAVEAWQDLLRRFPQAPEAQEANYRLADTQFGLGLFAEAVGTYERLQASYPNGKYAADAAFGLANCYYNQKNDDQAILAFGEFLENYPYDSRTEDAELGIQSAYYRSGKDMEEYLATNPDSPLAADYYWTKGQNAFAETNYEAAARSFERVTLDYAGSESAPGALFYLAESYYRMEQHQQAIAVYKNFIQTHGEDELVDLARFREGTSLYKLGNFENAASNYELLADLSPDGEYSALALYNAGLCYQEIEDWAGAIGVLVRFQSEYPTDERANGIWSQIAAIYQDELGDYDSAIASYDKALQKGEMNVEEIGYKQGECYEKLGRINDALTSYEASAGGGDRSAPHRIASLAQIGQLSEDMGDWGTAMNAYTRIVNSNVKPEWTAMAEGRIQEIKAITTGQ
jgi:tetratricopeptide (TPR) repeat protein